MVVALAWSTVRWSKLYYPSDLHVSAPRALVIRRVIIVDSAISFDELATVVEISVLRAAFAIVLCVIDRTIISSLLAMVRSMLDSKGSATHIEIVNISEER